MKGKNNRQRRAAGRDGSPRIACFNIWENTERPDTIEEGTYTPVGTGEEGVLSAFEEFRNGKSKKGRIPELWDGKASERIVNILLGRPYKPFKPKVNSKDLSHSD